MNKLKWACIGCGGIADKRTLPGLMLSNNAELIAVCDLNSVAVEQCREKYNAKYGFTDYKEMLKLNEIDVVYISSPVFCHVEQVKACADANKNILLEKPMALTSKDAEELKEYCKSKDVLLGVGFMMRFASVHQKMKEIVESGKIGQVVSMSGRLDCWYPPLGVWRQKLATSGGGSMMDMAIHCVDLLSYITGTKPVEVTGMVANQVHDYESEDGGSAVIRMNNGAFMNVQANFNAPISLCNLEIYGTKGALVAEGTVGQVESGKCRMFLMNDDNSDIAMEEELDVERGNMYTKEVEAFTNAVINKTKAPVSAEDAILNQRVIEAVYLSSKEKKTITL